MEVRSFVGNGIRNALLLSLPENGKDKIEEALFAFQEYYSLHSEDNTRPYPGITELLFRLEKEGYGMGVVSNKRDENVKPLIGKYFPQIPLAIGEREGIRRKPAPDSVLEAMNLLGCQKEECVYIGDSDVDVLTAIHAGVIPIAVTWGFRDEAVLLEAGAKFMANTPQELYEIIRKILG
jgi:phosphoglycolate phosphatase